MMMMMTHGAFKQINEGMWLKLYGLVRLSTGCSSAYYLPPVFTDESHDVAWLDVSVDDLLIMEMSHSTS